ncbi:MAG TPA: sulfate ABC transporter permease subunit CysT [Polyangia bacterium]
MSSQAPPPSSPSPGVAAGAARARRFRAQGWRPGVLPGFAPTLTFTVASLSMLVIIPLGFMILKTASLSWADFITTVTSDRALAAYRLSFGGALVAGAVNAVAGFLLAWILVRYDFFGKGLVDALIDLPLALPTAVAGIALTAIYAPNGVLGQFLEGIGIKVAFSPIGVIVAMIFVGLPFAVRTVQPVLMEIDPQAEEAAAVLGASRWFAFRRVILRALIPALLTGFGLAFARAVGEYGSIVFISGNMPMVTEIVPLLIVTKLEQYQYQEATALAVVMLVGSFLTLLLVNFLQSRSRKGHARG